MQKLIYEKNGLGLILWLENYCFCVLRAGGWWFWFSGCGSSIKLIFRGSWDFEIRSWYSKENVCRTSVHWFFLYKYHSTRKHWFSNPTWARLDWVNASRDISEQNEQTFKFSAADKFHFDAFLKMFLLTLNLLYNDVKLVFFPRL